MLKMLSGLTIRKAHGLDNIPSRVLRDAALEVAFPLATVFSYSLITGTISSEWKRAKVKVIYRCGHKEDPPVTAPAVFCR